jgi:hypothetical protein
MVTKLGTGVEGGKEILGLSVGLRDGLRLGLIVGGAVGFIEGR